MSHTTFGNISDMPCHPSDGIWYSEHNIDCKIDNENGIIVTYCKRCGTIIETKPLYTSGS